MEKVKNCRRRNENWIGLVRKGGQLCSVLTQVYALPSVLEDFQSWQSLLISRRSCPEGLKEVTVICFQKINNETSRYVCYSLFISQVFIQALQELQEVGKIKLTANVTSLCEQAVKDHVAWTQQQRTMLLFVQERWCISKTVMNKQWNKSMGE